MSHIVVVDGKRVIASGTVFVFPDDQVIEVSVEKESVFFDLQIGDRKVIPAPVGSPRHVVLPDIINESALTIRNGLNVRYGLESFGKTPDSYYIFTYTVYER